MYIEETYPTYRAVLDHSKKTIFRDKDSPEGWNVYEVLLFKLDV
jgi:hypothetical protein